MAIENRPQRTSLVVMVLGDLRQQFSSLGRHRPGGGRVTVEANLAKLGQQKTDPGEIGQIVINDSSGRGSPRSRFVSGDAQADQEHRHLQAPCPSRDPDVPCCDR